MNFRRSAFVALFFAPVAYAQASLASGFAPRTTLPVEFTQSVSAAHAHVGDAVQARTTQAVKLENGTVLPAGAVVTGHVVAVNAFVHDDTPYAQQRAGRLELQFDRVQSSAVAVPLRASLRAMASPIVTNDAMAAKSTDLDSLATTTQVGGDQRIPSQAEIRDRDGDVVGYNRRDGAYGRLIANGPCDASSDEVSLDRFSASACGLYGFDSVQLVPSASSVALISTHGSPQVWKHSTALLEVLPESAQ